jgi:WD40 repeat protein
MAPRIPAVEYRSLFGFYRFGLGLWCLPDATKKRVAFLLLLLSAGLVFVQPCAGGSGAFENTGSLASARHDHTATLLPNGKVLVLAGNDFPYASPYAELYAPEIGTWTATGNPTTLRADPTATLLSNGKVLLAAGAGPGYDFMSAELYDSASGNWASTGNMAGARRSHTATLLSNGKVLVAAGFFDDLGYVGFPIDTAELYDPASGTWTLTGSLATARFQHTATLLPSGKVLVAGGANRNNLLAIAELYYPASGTWTSTGSLATARAFHTATLLPNGKVLVAGGYDGSAELYDPAKGTWAATGSLATARAFHTATLLPNGKVLVAGGYVYPNDLASAELYDSASGTWTATGSLATARDSHTATLLTNGNVLVAAGLARNTQSVPLASAELYITPPTLLNISTRLRVLTGDKVLIGGLIITGTQPKKVIIRAIGPSLTALGISGALSDPTLELHDSSGATVHNDDWQTTIISDFGSDQAGEIRGSGLAPLDPHESAMIVYLIPGAYTAVVRGKNDGTGVALVDAYDLDPTATSQLANISTRGFVDTGDNVMIGGFIVGGQNPHRVIVRAIGPSLPVPGALGDPTLELHDGSGTTIATNDNWKTRPDGSSQQAEIEATTIPPTNDLESALVRTLPPGNYTAVVRGNNTATGVGLVEVYNLP